MKPGKKKNNKPTSLEFVELRRQVIIAFAKHDELSELVYLKGGNAISVVYHLGDRSSEDLDFSLNEDFPDVELAKSWITEALTNHFADLGYVPDGIKLEPRPKVRKDLELFWGGYRLFFKLVAADLWQDHHKTDPAKLGREALVVGKAQERVFEVDFSKHEYTEAYVVQEVEHYNLKVYSLEAIVYEKLRAICQQMPNYAHTAPHLKKARSRDFYDITIISKLDCVELWTPDSVKHARGIFEAKEVAPELLLNIREQEDFHRSDWPAVLESLSKPPKEDYCYFVEQTVELAENLHRRWHP